MRFTAHACFTLTPKRRILIPKRNKSKLNVLTYINPNTMQKPSSTSFRVTVAFTRYSKNIRNKVLQVVVESGRERFYHFKAETACFVVRLCKSNGIVLYNYRNLPGVFQTNEKTTVYSLT